ncbi:Meiosis regulator and mRNA stability factor 1 [Gracilaria domingensis]|nr:Meiosis regulator and mRNA stability factor 1 [Gracilaria domingensis]
MSLRAPAGRAGAAAAVLSAVAATASLCYAIRRYRRAAARARASSSSPRTLAVRSAPLPPLVRCATAGARPFSWVVFWDLENIHVPSSTSPAAFVHALCRALRSVAPHPSLSHPQPVLRMLAVANIHSIPLHQRKSLQSSGVSILHFETNGRKDACDKALITELCLLPREHAPPMGVALLSADVDFAYALSRLTALGYYTVVVAPNMGTISRQLASVPNAVLTFDHIFAHFTPLIVPQSQNNPNVKPATAQKQAHRTQRAARNPHKQQTSPEVKPVTSQQPVDQKQRAQRNARKRQRNAKASTKAATAQQDAEKKPRNASKRQQKPKSPKQSPVVSSSKSSTDNANAQRKVTQRSATNDVNDSPVLRSHSATATQSLNSSVLTPVRSTTRIWCPMYFVSLLSVLCTLGVLLWFRPAHSLSSWWLWCCFR